MPALKSPLKSTTQVGSLNVLGKFLKVNQTIEVPATAVDNRVRKLEGRGKLRVIANKRAKTVSITRIK